MQAQLARPDSTEKTIVLGPLDTFPVDETKPLSIAMFPAAAMRLPSGVPVRVCGGSFVPERRTGHEEETFVMRPSGVLRFRRALRALGVDLRGSLRARLRPLTRLVAAELARAPVAAAGMIADVRSLAPEHRRTAAGAFLAGVVVTSCVALIL